MQVLDEQSIQSRLQTLSDWSEIQGSIQRTYQLSDFKESIAFVDKVATLAEERDHHPDILIRYNKVTLTLSTHDAGGITEKDFELATQCDALV
ncbi:MAG: 4a-hydroxytetrahydrobiopterin dehydratase [Planctomycetota bacterium]|jgi:4a-hydroxytetrahydrobiopterin dehydratase